MSLWSTRLTTGHAPIDLNWADHLKCAQTYQLGYPQNKLFSLTTLEPCKNLCFCDQMGAPQELFSSEIHRAYNMIISYWDLEDMNTKCYH